MVIVILIKPSKQLKKEIDHLSYFIIKYLIAIDIWETKLTELSMRRKVNI